MPVASGRSAMPGSTRCTPSRRMPARVATRSEAALRGSTSAWTRWRPGPRWRSRRAGARRASRSPRPRCRRTATSDRSVTSPLGRASTPPTRSSPSQDGEAKPGAGRALPAPAGEHLPHVVVRRAASGWPNHAHDLVVVAVDGARDVVVGPGPEGDLPVGQRGLLRGLGHPPTLTSGAGRRAPPAPVGAPGGGGGCRAGRAPVASRSGRPGSTQGVGVAAGEGAEEHHPDRAATPRAFPTCWAVDSTPETAPA